MGDYSPLAWNRQELARKEDARREGARRGQEDAQSGSAMNHPKYRSAYKLGYEASLTTWGVLHGKSDAQDDAQNERSAAQRPPKNHDDSKQRDGTIGTLQAQLTAARAERDFWKARAGGR